MLINFSVNLSMENIIYVKQASRMKQQVLGNHVAGPGEWQGDEEGMGKRLGCLLEGQPVTSNFSLHFNEKKILKYKVYY